jgi:hypothetical protein
MLDKNNHCGMNLVLNDMLASYVMWYALSVIRRSEIIDKACDFAEEGRNGYYHWRDPDETSDDMEKTASLMEMIRGRHEITDEGDLKDHKNRIKDYRYEVNDAQLATIIWSQRDNPYALSAARWLTLTSGEIDEYKRALGSHWNPEDLRPHPKWANRWTLPLDKWLMAWGFMTETRDPATGVTSWTWPELRTLSVVPRKQDPNRDRKREYNHRRNWFTHYGDNW